MIDIVIGIDGTNSQEYKNRSVQNFCNAVRADHVIYKPGPQNTITGSDWIEIRDTVIRELNDIAKLYGEESFSMDINAL